MRPTSVNKWPVVLVLVLAWFNWGDEGIRRGQIPDLKAHPLLVFSPPWWPLRAYVSRTGDEEVYFEDSRLALGEDANLEYLAGKSQAPLSQALPALKARVRAGSGLRLPYRDFPFEYPPVPLALMLVPRLFVSTLPGYRLAYGILAALLAIAACAVGVRLCRDMGLRGPKDPWKAMALFVLAAGPVLVARFDILPALLVAVALLLLTRDLFFAAGLCAGAAIMTKLYPVFLLVPWVAVLVGERRVRDAITLTLGAVVAAVGIAAPFLMLAPDSFLRSTFVYGGRPFQIEGLVGAAVVLMGGKIVGSFGSFNVTTPGWLGLVWAPLLPLAIALVGGAAGAQARRLSIGASEDRQERTQRLARWTGAAVCLILLTSKVLSPQYLLWLLPVALVSGDIRVTRWAVAAAALTQVFYPVLYGLFAEDGNRLVALVVCCRNAALVMLAVQMWRGAGGIPILCEPVGGSGKPAP